MFLTYFLISALALGLDMGLLYLAVHVWGLHYLVAAPVAFLSGVAFVYALSARYAFGRRGLDWGWEFAAFILTGLVGLLINEAVLWLMVGHAGQSVMLGKALASMFSFGTNYMLRKKIMSRGARLQAAPAVAATQL